MTEEEFVHLESSIDRLNYARWILLEIKQHTGHPLVAPAFQFALVEYSKPYLKSYSAELNSKGKPKEEHKVDNKHIPGNHRTLHDRLLEARNRIHAHDDLGVKEAKLHVANTASGKFVGIVQNVIHGTEEFSNLDAIIDLIEQTLNSLHTEWEIQKAALPVNVR
jgi:hypothetical protein